MVSELEPCGSHFTQHFMKAVQSKKKIDKNTGDVLKEIYLDNSATTVTCEKAAQKALEIMTTQYGNPSSLHSKGLEAQLADLAKAEHFIFVSEQSSDLPLPFLILQSGEFLPRAGF